MVEGFSYIPLDDSALPTLDIPPSVQSVSNVLCDIKHAADDHRSVSPHLASYVKDDFLACFYGGSEEDKNFLLSEVQSFLGSFGLVMQSYEEIPPNYLQNVMAISDMMKSILPDVQKECQQDQSKLRKYLPAYVAAGAYDYQSPEIGTFVTENVPILLDQYYEEDAFAKYDWLLRLAFDTNNTRVIDSIEAYADTHPDTQLFFLPKLIAHHARVMGVDEKIIGYFHQIASYVKKTCDIDLRTLQADWMQDSFVRDQDRNLKEDVYINWEVTNLQMMASLEHARKGSVKALREEFGIRNFARFKLKDLIKQYDNKDRLDIEYGLCITGVDDYNNAGYNNLKAEQAHSKFVNAAERAHENVTVRFIEVGSVEELNALLVRLDSKYKSQQKAKFAYLQSHGSTGSIQLGHRTRPDAYIRPGDISKGRLQALVDILEEDATLVLESCSTGLVQTYTTDRNEQIQYEPIAGFFAIEGIFTVAPEADSFLDDVVLKRTNEGKYIFEEVYYLSEEKGVVRQIPLRSFRASKRQKSA